LIETYIDGDIELNEFIEHIQPKYGKKKGAATHAGTRRNDTFAANNRRISEMYASRKNGSHLNQD
jgi:hypothetical protein